ncbi:transporter substrate-binding domain-containing protein [Kyrpidia spormannii]|uniref:transporter substrate-binding domain-containing protein n=1 Tax=Kyrpidia spormannii TaxID=2055160 RepID=UPI0018D82357|nr:transporter substrate-binding domain-containing protein [Kyrpidia spormannii]
MSLFLVSACGAQSPSQPASGGSSAGSQAEDPTLAKIKSSGVINVGIEGAFPPFNYFNSNNQLEGFDVDITNEIAKRMGVKVNFVPTPWDSIITGLLARKYDIILSSMAITPERMQKVDFTDPYYHTGAQLFVPNNSTVTDPTKVKGMKIGVTVGTTYETKVTDLGAIPVTYKSDELAFTDLANGRIQGVVTDRGVGSWMIKDKKYPIKSVGDPLYTETIGIALNKGETGLRDEINKQLKAMMTDGTYTQISQKWFDKDIR